MDDAPERVTFETIAGILAADLVEDDIRIAMSEPKDLRLNTGVKIHDLHAELHFINTGVPHVVAFGADLPGTEVVRHGAAIRYHEAFAPAGTNANFATVLAPGHIAIRTYERGVEDETLACGTGMVASALIHHLLDGVPSPIRVDVKGGDTLEIGFEKTGESTFTNVTLRGPADFVFEGEIEL
jgi:diaminopimelate epimerase